MNIGDTVALCIDPKRRPFRVTGIHMALELRDGKYHEAGQVATITMPAWGELWIARVPAGKLEILEEK